MPNIPNIFFEFITFFTTETPLEPEAEGEVGIMGMGEGHSSRRNGNRLGDWWLFGRYSVRSATKTQGLV